MFGSNEHDLLRLDFRVRRSRVFLSRDLGEVCTAPALLLVNRITAMVIFSKVGRNWRNLNKFYTLQLNWVGESEPDSL